MRRIVPIDLGGSPTPCAVAPPRRNGADPETVRALIEHYAERYPDEALEVAFFHGGFPDDDLLDAAGGYPLRLSCHPADLTRERAARFRAAGGMIVELEAMTLDPHVLRTCDRGYTTGRVRTIAKLLREQGILVGIHLVPGLPGSDVDGALADADGLRRPEGAWVDFVRIWPALAFEGAKLSTWAETGRWVPYGAPEMIDVLAQMVSICDEASVNVIRIGIQPGQDIPVRVTAGPMHPNFRGEVESRRFGTRLALKLKGAASGSAVVVRVHPKDLAWAKGTSNVNARLVRTRYGLASLEFKTDESLERGQLRIGGQES